MGEDGRQDYILPERPELYDSGFFMPSVSDREYMLRAIELAERGRGLTRPNPLVASIIVKNDRIIAEDYHHGSGKPHAEILALRKAGKKARGAMLYVNLEPCCHTGRTGPCTNAIIAAGIRNVIYSCSDPDPRVAGKGARALRRAGITVHSGVCREEAQRLNDTYFGYYQNSRPYIIVKLAQSIDGRIATANGDSRWISSPQARTLAHRLRSEVDAVIVGAGTVRTDNPQLTVRSFKGINPYRIIVTGHKALPPKCRLLTENGDLLTIIATSESSRNKTADRGAIRWSVTGNKDGLSPKDLVNKAADFGLRSLMIEGGANLATSFIRARLVDKMIIITAPKIIGSGRDSFGDLSVGQVKNAPKLRAVKYTQVGDDLITTGYPEWGGA